MSGSKYVKNPNLSDMDIDKLFHIGLTTKDDLKATFGDVKVFKNLIILIKREVTILHVNKHLVYF